MHTSSPTNAITVDRRYSQSSNPSVHKVYLEDLKHQVAWEAEFSRRSVTLHATGRWFVKQLIQEHLTFSVLLIGCTRKRRDKEGHDC